MAPLASVKAFMKQNNDPQAQGPAAPSSDITRVFLENSAFLQAFLRRFIRRQQDIEDVAQEAYLKAYTAEQQQTVDHPKAFLFTIAKNIAINELRKKTHQVTDYIEECKTLPTPKASASLEEEIDAQQSLGVYCEAVAALPERCRRVYLLRRVHGLKQQEIADTLGISLRMVEKHLHKGVKECRAYINNKHHAAADTAAPPHSGLPKEGDRL